MNVFPLRRRCLWFGVVNISGFLACSLNEWSGETLKDRLLKTLSVASKCVVQVISDTLFSYFVLAN